MLNILQIHIVHLLWFRLGRLVMLHRLGSRLRSCILDRSLGGLLWLLLKGLGWWRLDGLLPLLLLYLWLRLLMNRLR